MRILIAVHHFPPNYQGGAEWRAYRTARALQERGFTVQVMSIERIDSNPAEGLTWQDDNFDGIAVRRLSFNLFSNPDPFLVQYNNPYIAEHLKTMLVEFRPDVFHLIGGYLMTGSVLETARAMGVPSVVSLTDYWYMCTRISKLRSDGSLCPPPFVAENCARCLGEEQRRYRWPARVAPGLMKRYWRFQKGRVEQINARHVYLTETLNQVDKIISPSEFLRQMYIDVGIDPQRIYYKRQGSYGIEPSSELLVKTNSDSLRLAYMGQIAPLKGVHVPIQAFQLRPEANMRLKIYGDPGPFPEYVAELRRLAGNDQRIEFPGIYPREKLSQIFQDVDVMVFPSIWYENSPNSILEAFVHRTPVVASRMGGMIELIEDGKNGLFFETGDAADLALQFDRLLGDRALVNSLREGIGPVKTISEEIDELVDVYQEAKCAP